MSFLLAQSREMRIHYVPSRPRGGKTGGWIGLWSRGLEDSKRGRMGPGPRQVPRHGPYDEELVVDDSIHHGAF